MDVLLDIIIKFLPTVIVSLFIAWFNRRQAKREENTTIRPKFGAKNPFYSSRCRRRPPTSRERPLFALKPKVNGEVATD